MLKKTFERVERWLIRTETYTSLWKMAKESPFITLGIAAVMAIWTYIVQTVQSINAMGWGIWPILGLLLTAATFAIYALCIAVVRYSRQGVGPPQTRITEPGQLAEAEVLVAKLTWTEGFLENNITKPWELVLTLDFKRTQKNFGCYVRWGKYTGFLNAKPKWVWTPQKSVVDPSICVAGRKIHHVIMTSSLEEQGVTIFDEPFHFSDEFSRKRICIEVSMASDEGERTERRYYSLVRSKRTAPVLLEDPKVLFSEVRDE